MTSIPDQSKPKHCGTWFKLSHCATCAVSFCAPPGSAVAQVGGAISEARRDDAEILIAQAVERYHAEDFDGAIKVFRDAYVLQGDPNLLFNIARCHEALGQPLPARQHYEAYLDDEQAEPVGIERARAALHRLDQADRDKAPARKEHAQRDTADARDEARPLTSVATRDEPSPTPRSGVAATDDAPLVDSTDSQWLEYTLLSLGTVALGVGGTFYALGAQDHDELENAEGYADPTRRFEFDSARARELEDGGDDKKTIGVLSMVAGGGFVVTAALLWLLSGDDDQSLQVGASGNTRGAELSVGGRF